MAEEDFSVGSNNSDDNERKHYQDGGSMNPHATHMVDNNYDNNAQDQEHTRMLQTAVDLGNEGRMQGGNFNYRNLGQVMPMQKSEVSKNYSMWYLMITGHIQSGTMNDCDGVSCMFDFTSGLDFQVHSGNDAGVSQHAYKSQQTNRRVVWNFPFELTYRSFGINGWPKLCLQFTRRNFMGLDVKCGYGVTHVPTQPGTHTRYVHVFAPISSNFIADLLGKCRGKQTEYVNHKAILDQNQGREVTRVVSAGIVKVQFHVTMKDIEKAGIHPFKA